jgi:hypothetical protein
MSLETSVNYFKKQDLNGEEIIKLTNKAPVLYSDLAKYKTIDDLLGKEGYVIILYQTSSKTTGHFVAITRNDKTGRIRYADSYAIRNPDAEIQYTPYDQSLPKYLSALLEGTNFESNTVDYQSSQKGVSTCGRWSSIFCLLRNCELSQISTFFKGNKGGFLQNSDNCATLITMWALNDITQFLSHLSQTGGKF